MKKIAAILVALLMLTTIASAEVYNGTTVAGRTVDVLAPTSGVLSDLAVEVGDRVTQGTLLAAISAKKVYASEEGMVSIVHAEEGDTVNGDILEILPLELYTVYCTSEKAYSSPSNMLIHAGEKVYIKCTKDGSHKAIGIVTSIDGNTYTTEVIGGELYVGETVWLYRGKDMKDKNKVGKGTVVVTSTVPYSINGKVISLNVEEGDWVEKGQLLYTWTDKDNTAMYAESDAIVVDLPVQKGTNVSTDQTVMTLAPANSIRIEFLVPEKDMSSIHIGNSVTVVPVFEQGDTRLAGHIDRINGIATEEGYAVWVKLDTGTTLPIGLHAEVFINE